MLPLWRSKAFFQNIQGDFYDASTFWVQNRGKCCPFFSPVIMETFDASTFAFMLSVLLKNDQGNSYDASTFGFKTGRNAVRFLSKTTRENSMTLTLLGSKQGKMLSV